MSHYSTNITTRNPVLKAYAILDGGGVKGAALVGGLLAAEESGIEFIGYGGTSAGAIVATLSAIGYSPNALKEIMINDLGFDKFVNENTIKHIGALKKLLTSMNNDSNALKKLFSLLLWCLSNQSTHKALCKDFGFDDGKLITNFICKKIKEIAGDKIKDPENLTFQELEDLTNKKLKIVASDISKRRAVVFPRQKSDSVLNAVRASMAYPFVFTPTKEFESFLVDGGLSSNLPSFLFKKESHKSVIPIIAFDLVYESATSEQNNPQQNNTLHTFSKYILDTALESSDSLMLSHQDGIHHIPIPCNVSALDFNIKPNDRRALFDAGKSAAHSYFIQNFHIHKQADTEIKQIQARYASTQVVDFILSQLIINIKEKFPKCTNVRANIMLPSLLGTDRIVVYQIGMDKDPDLQLRLPLDKGASGAVCKHAEDNKAPIVVFADLDEFIKNPSYRNDHREFELPRAESNKIPSSQKSIACAPIFIGGYREELKNELIVLGSVGVDTSTPLGETGWISENGVDKIADTSLQEIFLNWTDVLGCLFK